MKQVTYNDTIYRNIVKDIFKNKFDIELIDTPDSYFKTSDNRLFIPGKFNFDLIPNELVRSLTFVEVETVKKDNNIFNPKSKTFNVLASKYWKYCTCASQGGMFAYVQIDEDANPTGNIALIHSVDILTKCNIKNYLVLPSKVNFRRKVAVYEVPKKGIITFFNINDLDKSKTKISRLIKVNEETRIRYWDKFKNYAISNSDLNENDVLRFQGYSEISPFNEENFEYHLDTKIAKKFVFKLVGTEDFYLMTYEIVKNFSKRIEK